MTSFKWDKRPLFVRSGSSDIAKLLPGVDDAETISLGQDCIEWGIINGIYVMAV